MINIHFVMGKKFFLPNVILPLQFSSNKRKATLNKESGAFKTDSNAWNSGQEINLKHNKQNHTHKYVFQ